MRVQHYLRNLRDMGPVRRLGLQLLGEGASQSAVARELGVSRTTASNWAAWLADAAHPVDDATAAGAPDLSAAQLGALAGLLRGSARARGFPSDAWTMARVAVLIECEFGVVCGTVHAWRILDAARANASAAGAPVSLRRPAAGSRLAAGQAPAGRVDGPAASPGGCVRNATWAGGTGYTVASSFGGISRRGDGTK